MRQTPAKLVLHCAGKPAAMCLLLLVQRLRGAILAGLVSASIGATPGQASIIYGEFWDVTQANQTIDQALAAINGLAPTATFVSRTIDYPNGAQNQQSSNLSLAQFLGTDAPSIVGDGTATVETSVFRFSGFLDLLPGQQNFALGSDDGYRLTINDTLVSQRNRPRGFGFTTLDFDPGIGRVPFELIFYENFGRTGVEFFVDGALVDPAPIPLPSTASLGLLGLFALFGLRFRFRNHLALAPGT